MFFSSPFETIVGVNVYPPGTIVGVSTGTNVYLPQSTIVEVLDEQNNVLQVLRGQGQLTPIVVNVNGSFLTPECVPLTGIGTASYTIGIGTTSISIGISTLGIGIGTTSISIGIGTLGIGIGTTSITIPNAPENSYPVVACLEDLAILSEGVNYSSNDKIEIIPSNGAEFRPIFGKFGEIKEVELISKGCGFVDNPQIIIRSETGVNANIVPVFSFKRLRNQNDLDELLGIGLNTPVINVIDCVGKIVK